jgi:DNA-binding response OmpR family regulator
MTRILLLTDNLMTRVQLESRWRKAGADVRDHEDEKADYDLLVIDLVGPDAAGRVKRLKARHPGSRLIAFGPHVDGAAFKAAKAAGADECVARGSVIDRVLARIETD